MPAPMPPTATARPGSAALAAAAADLAAATATALPPEREEPAAQPAGLPAAPPPAGDVGELADAGAEDGEPHNEPAGKSLRSTTHDSPAASRTRATYAGAGSPLRPRQLMGWTCALAPDTPPGAHRLAAPLARAAEKLATHTGWQRPLPLIAIHDDVFDFLTEAPAPVIDPQEAERFLTALCDENHAREHIDEETGVLMLTFMTQPALTAPLR